MNHSGLVKPVTNWKNPLHYIVANWKENAMVKMKKNSQNI
uniref:Uncharacterized protein n=1 Tax=Romanomermis culicivorax TaxID=13658 RepID=A0A915J8W9_ROMCU